MRSLTTRSTVVLAAAALVVVAGCSGARKAGVPADRSALATRTTTSGSIGVSVTPKRVDATGAQFDVQLNNHEVDLNGSYAATSTLTVGGIRWTDPRWSGDGPGGHHRSGTLTFATAGPVSGEIELRVGLPQPVTVRWTVAGPAA